MRVKISYTAHVDEVRSEAAYLVNNLGATINESIELFNQIVINLKAEDFNSTEWYLRSQNLRKNLARLDTRLVEVEQIVMGLEDYERGRVATDGVGVPETVSGPEEWMDEPPEAEEADDD